ncbi:hypothetical protein DNTS_007119 [Danionella cerebrum]|uniref:CARD domain-containing protein n=1 Tax=Danionella cerebrum TaxID=2873325 RepID=A0A553QWU7_9TELE|nr:hypothetical protein DNTS_007119 [Danionella translucida]
MEGAHLTEDEMADIKKEKIIAERHFDFLRSRKILTREDTEYISCGTTRGRRTSKLLDILCENPRGLDTLIESIRWGRTLNFIIAKITDEVQRVKNERIEALKAGSSASSADPIAKAATNDFSKLNSDYDKHSTMCLHQEREGIASSSSFNLRFSSASLGAFGGEGGGGETDVSSSLPKPGDPGAPALPKEPEEEDEENACEDHANFQPLRSRSVFSRPL